MDDPKDIIHFHFSTKKEIYSYSNTKNELKHFFFSVIGLVINLILVFGVFYAISCTLVVWLVAYSINISGCFILFGVVINLLIKRHEEDNDISSGTMMISLVPLILAILYIICWCFVFKLWRKVRERENLVFVCVE